MLRVVCATAVPRTNFRGVMIGLLLLPRQIFTERLCPDLALRGLSVMPHISG